MQTESSPPILILRRDSVSRDDIRLARKAGIIVIQVKDPADCRYMEPPLARPGRLPAIAARLVREVLKGDFGSGSYVDKDKVRARLLAMFMAQEEPEKPVEPSNV